MSAIKDFEHVEDRYSHSECTKCGYTEENELNVHKNCPQSECEGELEPFTVLEGESCKMCLQFDREPREFLAWDSNVYEHEGKFICEKCVEDIKREMKL